MIEKITKNGVTINSCSGSTIRLVYKGNSLLDAWRGDSGTTTETVQNIIEFDTPQEAYQWVVSTGLEYDESIFVETYGQEIVDSWKSGQELG